MNPPVPQDNNLIRISVEDANSEHVESLLRRQMSLRGEKGITAVKKRRWYYQSWFVLMISAGLLAFTAWFLIEPYFEDMIRLQGPITAMDVSDLETGSDPSTRPAAINLAGDGWIQIGPEKILIIGQTELWSHGKAAPLSPTDFKVGQEVCAYVEPVAVGGKVVTFAHFIDPSPKPQPASRASMSLSQLEAQKTAAGILLFPLVAGFIGIGVAAADGILCRLWRRALLCGAVGLLVGVVGGFVATILAGVIYQPLTAMAMKQVAPGATHLPPFVFLIQMCGRGLAWLLAGTAMGLGQGIALRSKRLLLYGFLGGIVGGLVGGLLFDPIDILIFGMNKPSAHIARMIGLTLIGLIVGAMIGVVELLARGAWLRMTEGPLTGKEFLLFKDTMRIGSSSRSDIYLFNDPQVSPQHAIIRTLGDQSEIDGAADAMLFVNSRPTKRARLRHGDQITIGRTSFLFQSRKG
jgi:hypothetical protein